jgi:hypothetical protein
MNFETLFEDLESQLVEVNHCFETQARLAKCNQLRLQVDSEEMVLIAPILGSDFVAGFHERRGAWMCVGLPKAGVLKFSIDEKSRMPKLRRRSVKFEDFIEEMNPPFSAQFKPTGKAGFAGVLIAVENALVYFTPTGDATGLKSVSKSVTAIDLAALDWLAALEDKDLADVTEWRDR